MSTKKKISIANEIITLTDKEIVFVKSYIADGSRNASASAIHAGYSKKTAGQIGHTLLKKVEIQKYIQHLSAPVLDRLGITQEKIMKEYATVAFSNLSDFLTSDYQPKPMTELDQEKIAAISSVKVNESVHQEADGREIKTRHVELKFHDKLKSLSFLAEMTGLVKRQEDPQQSLRNNFYREINNYYNSK